MPSSPKDKYAVVGLGTLLLGPKETFTELGFTARAALAEAARLAIEDAGLQRKDITGALDLRRAGGAGERVTFSDAYPRVLGLPVNFYYTVGRGGSLAGLGTATALGLLEAGIADYIVLAGAVDDYSRMQVSKKQGNKGMVHIDKDGYWGKPFGDLQAVSHHSFFGARHMAEFGTTSRQLGMIAVQQRQWANLNPKARMYERPMTIEDHQNSPITVWPYHLFDMAQVSDGAVAFILTTADRAKDCAKTPVYVKGVGFGEAMSNLWWDKKNYTTLAVAPAKEQAFGQAGITLADIDFAQLYDCFTGEVLMQLEDYGWCKKGEGGAFVEEGHIGPGGDVPVNTSGGLLSAYHLGDLTGLAEAVWQLREEAGKRQVKDANTGFVTGHGGEILSPGMCSIHSCLVLGR